MIVTLRVRIAGRQQRVGARFDGRSASPVDRVRTGPKTHIVLIAGGGLDCGH